MEMMRALLILAGFFLALAHNPSIDEQADCLVDGGEASSELMDSAIYIWAAMKRCGQNGEKMKCAVDISSATRSVNAMINIILKAVDKCGALKTANPECGLAASTLTQHMAGLAEASGDIIQKCPNSFQHAAHAHHWQHNSPALCVIDLKDSAKSLLEAIRAFSRVKLDCKESKRECSSNALRIVAAFAGLGHYLTGAIGHCSNTPEIAHCGAEIADLVRHTAEVARAGLDLSDHCGKGVKAAAGKRSGQEVEVMVPVEVGVRPRLYEQMDDDHSDFSSTNIVLAAFLPVSAIVGFLGGRSWASRRETIIEPLE